MASLTLKIFIASVVKILSPIIAVGHDVCLESYHEGFSLRGCVKMFLFHNDMFWISISKGWRFPIRSGMTCGESGMTCGELGMTPEDTLGWGQRAGKDME